MKCYERNRAFRQGHSFGAMLMLLSALLFGSVGSAGAQSSYNWQGNKVDNVLYKNGGRDASRSEADPSKVVFLQNVGTGKWLRPGGPWGTQLSLGDVATELWICKDNVTFGTGILPYWTKDYYFINTAVGTAQGSWISNITDQQKKYEQGLFMDNNKGEGGVYAAWNFVDCGDNTYAISSRYPNKPSTLKSQRKPEDSYLSYDAQNDAVVLKTVPNKNNDYGTPDVDGLKADKNNLWRIVTMADVYKAAETTSSASMSEPFNVTFLVKDQGLDRFSSFNTVWQTSAKDNKGTTGLKLGVEKVFSSKLDGSHDENRYGTVSGDKSERDAEAKANGQYFCGQVKSDPNSNFHQTITIPRTGWYRVSCQGFTDDTENRSYLYASCDGKMVSKGLASIKDFDGEGTVPTDLTEAGKMFRKHQYFNSLYIYAKSGSTLDMGLEFVGANSWTAFDDFQLAYCGNDNPQLVLDETKDNLDYITTVNSQYNGFKGAMLYLHRKMNANVWNTIVLPVSLTMAQCRDLFGNNTQIAKFTDYANGHIRFDRVENENTKDDDVVMEANVPYIVKPTRAEGDGGRDGDKLTNKEVQYQDKYQQPITVTCTAPYATTFITNPVDTKFMDNSDDLMGGAVEEHNGLQFRGTLVKTFEGTTAKLNLVGKYIIYNGKIYHVTQPYGLNGMKGYFAFTEPTPAKISISVDGVTVDESETTGIDQLFSDNATAKQGKNVYNLNGQRVSADGSLSNLPKGVYIVNGKKYIVK